MSHDPDEYAPPSALAERFQITTRSLERWGKTGEVRTTQNPLRRGKLYHVADVARLAAAVRTAQKIEQPEPGAPTPGTEVVPQSELLAALTDTQDKLNRAMLEVGRLQGQLEAQQKLLAVDEERRVALESERDRVVAEHDRLRADLSRLPWWVRIVFLRGR
jgi:hypothetical protein